MRQVAREKENNTAQRKKGKRSKLIPIIAAVLVLIGCGVILYPTVEEYFYGQDIARQKQSFMDEITGSTGEDEAKLPFEELYLMLKAENEKLYETGQAGLVDAFSYETVGVDLSAYGIKDDCIGFIRLPTISIELPIYLGANNENMRKGAVHLTQTSYPIGGENTNSVIAAHRGTTKVMFRNIHELKENDPIYITNFREELVYRVVSTKIIRPDDISQVLIQEGKDMLTLFSCNPIGSNYERYVVYCERVNP